MHTKLEREWTALNRSKADYEAEIQNLEQEIQIDTQEKEDLEEDIQERHEEFQRNIELHQEQFSELLESTREERYQQQEEKLQNDYEERYMAAVAQLRAQCDEQLHDNRLEQEELYYRKEMALRSELNMIRSAFQGREEELQDLEGRLAAMERQYIIMLDEGSKMKAAIPEIQAAWNADKAGFTAERSRLLQIRSDMQAEMEQMIAEYQNILEIKVALVNEINTYRTLLEGEEERYAIMQILKLLSLCIWPINGAWYMYCLTIFVFLYELLTQVERVLARRIGNASATATES